MKQLFLIPFIVVLLMLNIAGEAQVLKQHHLDYMEAHHISLVDNEILYRDILKNNNKVKMLVIFTNHCAGTPYVFNDIARYREKFGDKMEFILCSSASKNDMEDLTKIVKSFEYKDSLYFINPAKYKEYRMDDRKKGFAFRNDICEPCKDDIIGVPYRIFFSSDNKVLFYGYSSKKNFDELLDKYFAESVR